MLDAMMRKPLEAIFYAISIGAIAIGGIFWLTMIYYQGDANAHAIIGLQDKQNTILQMQTDIAVIREKIDRIESHLSEEDKDAAQ